MFVLGLSFWLIVLWIFWFVLLVCLYLWLLIVKRFFVLILMFLVRIWRLFFFILLLFLMCSICNVKFILLCVIGDDIIWMIFLNCIWIKLNLKLFFIVLFLVCEFFFNVNSFLWCNVKFLMYDIILLICILILWIFVDGVKLRNLFW